RGPDAVEVIVADNESTDETAEIARSRGCEVVHVEKRIIAAVRNGGAAKARGEILAFVDADMQIHPDTFNVIDDLAGSGTVVAGATGFRFERSSYALKLTYQFLIIITSMLTRQMSREVPTGVFFCLRSAFEEIGGYDEGLHYAEDVDIILRLKKFGRRRRMRFVCGTDAKAIFSTRKFDRYGDWHYFTMPWKWLIGAIVQRTRVTRSARAYWYEDR
ncbi:MAG: glycosyltransferase, partial [Thermoanaerobaculia bacterium]|nr:glycosyltransferase [Thermoanaerobaculia bacterium]